MQNQIVQARFEPTPVSAAFDARLRRLREGARAGTENPFDLEEARSNPFTRHPVYFCGNDIY